MTTSPSRTALVLHGGAGTMTPVDLSSSDRRDVALALGEALEAGHSILRAGGPALDAVAATILVLEDSPWFNAGKGAVFNAEGGHELDAALMEGHTKQAGAIAGVTTIKNPILLARAVLERSPHVFLIGAGAERFADTMPELERVDPSYFSTEYRRLQLEAARAHEAIHGVGAYFGTVGAIALDAHGHLAAGTSTGGLSNKRYGRVGDSPVIGAGTYADEHVGVSATGSGEFYIRLAVAHDIRARVAYRGESVEEATRAIIFEELPRIGGDGGVIALDARGNIAFPFNTTAMYRGSVDVDGKRTVAIFAEEETIS